MPGASSYPAGSAPAGASPLAPANIPRGVVYPKAIQFDGATGDYLLDDNGRYVECHPVTQRVVLKLLVKLGSIGSAPTQGAAFKNIVRGTPAQRTNQVQQIVKDTLKDDIAAGDIKLVEIDVDTSTPSATITAVYFVNLRENPTGTAQPFGVTIRS